MDHLGKEKSEKYGTERLLYLNTQTPSIWNL